MKKMKKKNKKSSVLIVSMLILGAVITIALSLALVAIRERNTSMSSSRTQVAYQMADQGVETVMNALLKVNVGTTPTRSYLPPVGNYSDGVLTINDVLTGRFGAPVALSSSCISGAACCVNSGADSGKIFSPDGGKSFEVTLVGTDASGNAINLNCQDNAIDIYDIKEIKSVGYDLNARTSRAIQARVNQKSKSLKLFLDMESTLSSTSAPQDISRMHNTVDKTSNPVFGYDNTEKPFNYGFSSVSFNNANNGYFQVDSTSNANLTKDFEFKFDTDIDKSSATFTIDFWIKVDNLGDNNLQSLFTMKNTQVMNLALHRKPGNKYFIRLTTKNFATNPGDNIVADFEQDNLRNGWHHIALVRSYGLSADTGAITVYIDGNYATNDVNADKISAGADCSVDSNKTCVFKEQNFSTNKVLIGGDVGDADTTGIPAGNTHNCRSYIDLLRIKRSVSWSGEFHTEVDGADDMDKLYE
jgi:hypothetical protein